jgi:hypothetical protein
MIEAINKPHRYEAKIEKEYGSDFFVASVTEFRSQSYGEDQKDVIRLTGIPSRDAASVLLASALSFLAKP